MSLEEIEEKLSNVVKAEMIAQLKSSVWKERLEAIQLLKEEVGKRAELDHSAELLIWVLHVVPGWNEKNVQVRGDNPHCFKCEVGFTNDVVICRLAGISERGCYQNKYSRNEMPHCFF